MGLDGPLRAAAFEEEGRRLLTITTNGSLRVWETNGTCEVRAEWGGLAPVAGFSRDAKRFAGLCRDGSFRAWDVPSGRCLLTLPVPGRLRELKWSTTGEWVGWVSGAPGLHVYKTDQPAFPELPATWRDTAPVDALAFSHDGTRVASAHAERTLRIWRLSDGLPVADPIQVDVRQCRLAFAEADRWSLSHDENGASRAWDSGSGKPVAARLTRQMIINAWEVDAERRQLAAGIFSGWIFLMEMEPREPRHSEMQHGPPLHDAVFSPDCQFVATAGSDGPVRIWNPANGEQVFEVMQHPAAVKKCVFSPDGSRLLTACDDGAARFRSTRP